MDKQQLLKLLDDPTIMKAIEAKLAKEAKKAIKKVTVADVTYYNTCKLCGSMWETTKDATFIGSVTKSFNIIHESCMSCWINLLTLSREQLVAKMIEMAKSYLCQGRVR